MDAPNHTPRRSKRDPGRRFSVFSQKAALKAMNLDIKNPLFAIYSHPLSRAKHLCSPFAGTDHACCGRSGKF